MLTYWLYYNGQPIASVRESSGQSANTIRGIAIAQHERNPTLYADHPAVLPGEHRERLRFSTVRIFPGEG